MFEHGPAAVAMDLAFWSQGITNPRYPLSQLGALSLEVSEKFRALAIMQLLTEASTDLFLHNLMRSGRARETYLVRLAQAGVTADHHQASGRYGPLLDSIAANDLERARRIAILAGQQFRAGHEYEDDYCYAQLLARLIADGEVPRAEVDAFFQQFEIWLAGDANPRFDVCRALVDADQAAFDDAFEGLLLDHELAVEAARERGQHEDDPVRAERQVFVEGLAILRIASLHGLTTATEYRYCPSLARLPMTHPFPAV